MRALIICTLLLLHGMMSMAHIFPSYNKPDYLPRCGAPCTGRRGECPVDCKHCLLFANRREPACASRRRFK
uniref:Putative 5.3 kDa protein n=1 Tax=Ixodes ricinus TaxID=34613 RepID=A0A0K8R6V8_IXORI